MALNLYCHFVMKIIKYNVGWFCWSLFIIYVLLIRQPDLPQFNVDWLIPLDKIAHSFLFAVLGLLLITAFLLQKPAWFSNLMGTVALNTFAAAFAVITELLQYWLTSYRKAELTDVLADFSGLIIGGGIMELFLKNKILLSNNSGRS